MDEFLGAAGRGLRKVFFSLFLYLAGSFLVMLLTTSLMTGKFPPPIFETFQQLRSLSGLSKSQPVADPSDALGEQEMVDALNKSIALLKEDFSNVSPAKRKQLRETIKVMEKMRSNISRQVTQRNLKSPAAGSPPSVAESIAHLKNHNKELEEAYNSAGGDSTSSSTTSANPPSKTPAAVTPAAEETHQELRKMRFELDVLKSQMLYSRQEIERLKAQTQRLYPASPAVQTDMRAAAYRQSPTQKPRSK